VSRSLRNLLLALLLVVIVIATAGRHYWTTSSTTTTSTTTTSTTTTSVVSSSTSTTLANVTSCRGSQFTGVNVGSQGAAGTGYDTMTLTKVAGTSCVIDGYPLVTMQSAQGTVVSSQIQDATDFPAGPASGAPVAHTIVVGQKIDVQLRYADQPVGTQVCPSVQHVDVQFVAGDASVPVTFAYPITVCGSTVSVSPFYPG